MKKISTYLFIILIILLLYNTQVSSKKIIIKEYSVTNNKITDYHHGLKIVHFSDLHYGTSIKLEELKEIVQKINKLKPDLVFFTGDLLDLKTEYNEEELKVFIEEFNKITPTMSSFIIKGNHDYTNVFNKIVDETNFKLLNNEIEYFYLKDQTPIKIMAVGSLLEKDAKINTLKKEDDNDLFTILLLHEPDLIKDIDLADIDLVLAGHSHNGQIRIPFIGAIVKPVGAKTYYDERYFIGDTKVFISSGLGTSRVHFRMFNPRSINFYRLNNH